MGGRGGRTGVGEAGWAAKVNAFQHGVAPAWWTTHPHPQGTAWWLWPASAA